MKKKSLKILSLFIAVAIISSCAKTEIEPKRAEEIQHEKRIESLKIFMSKQIGVDTTILEYNEKTQMFSMLGHEQISLEKLTELYNVAKRK
ncbi:hypothetical protein D3C87_1677910 [compost metagenome]